MTTEAQIRTGHVSSYGDVVALYGAVIIITSFVLFHS